MKKLLSILFPFDAAESIFTILIIAVVYPLIDNKAVYLFGLAIAYAILVSMHMAGIEPRYRFMRVSKK